MLNKLSITLIVINLVCAAQAQQSGLTVLKYDIKTQAQCGEIIPAPSFESTCAGEITVTETDRLFSGGCAGTIERVYLAIDACGNSLEAIKYIHLSDTTAPHITQELEDIQVKDMTTLRMARPLAEDNCEGKLIWTTEDIPLKGGLETGVSRVFTVIDACGNSTSTSVKITVVK